MKVVLHFFKFFCTAVIIPLISNKKQAVTNILRVIHISGGYKQLNLWWKRQLTYKKCAFFFKKRRTNKSQKRSLLT